MCVISESGSQVSDLPFVKTYRDRFASRSWCAILDITGAHDAYLVQENRLVGLFYRYVFPTRGWAPDALVLRIPRQLRTQGLAVVPYDGALRTSQRSWGGPISFSDSS